MKHSPGFLALVAAARRRVREVTVPLVKEKLRRGDSFLLLDVREEHEWDAGRITGARYLGKGVIERDIEKLAPDRHTEIILYCGGGYRSVLAADALHTMGYPHAASMAGGWKGWRRAHGAVTMPAGKSTSRRRTTRKQ